MLCSCACLEATFSASLEWGSSLSCGCLVRCLQEPMESEWCAGFDPNPTQLLWLTSLQSPELTDFLISPSQSVSQGLPHGSYISIPCPLSCTHSLLWGIKQISNIFSPVRTLEKFQQGCAWLDSALLCYFEKWKNYSTSAINCVNNSFYHRIAYINILSCVPLHPRLREMIWWSFSDNKHFYGFKTHQLKILDDWQATAGTVRKSSLVLNGPGARKCLCVSITLPWAFYPKREFWVSFPISFTKSLKNSL